MADKDTAERGALSKTLSLGVWASGIPVLVGIILSSASNPALGGKIILAGLKILIATPLLGLAVLTMRYAMRGAFKWAGLCAGLLALIALSALLGH
jgi:uncharacterized membrane protein